MKEYKTLAQIIEQLDMCKFEDEIGHPLENNVAFIALVKKAKKEGCENWGEHTPGVMGPCYKCSWCNLFTNDGKFDN